jgi:hypothetical protein
VGGLEGAGRLPKVRFAAPAACQLTALGRAAGVKTIGEPRALASSKENNA